MDRRGLPSRSDSGGPGDADAEGVGVLGDLCLREWGISLAEFYDIRPNTDASVGAGVDYGLTLERLHELLDGYEHRRRADALSNAIVLATAFNSPKDLKETVDKLYPPPESGIEPPTEADFEEWSWATGSDSA